MNTDVSAFSFLLLMAILIALFSSCSGTAIPQDHFEYTDIPFDARIEGNVDGLSFCADIKSTFIGEERTHYIDMRFISPESLSGMIVTVRDGKVSARLGGISVEDLEDRDLPMYIRALCHHHTASVIHKNKDGSYTVTVCDKNCNFEYVFDRERLIPTKISGKSETGTFSLAVLNFTAID